MSRGEKATSDTTALLQTKIVESTSAALLDERFQVAWRSEALSTRAKARGSRSPPVVQKPQSILHGIRIAGNFSFEVASMRRIHTCSRLLRLHDPATPGRPF